MGSRGYFFLIEFVVVRGAAASAKREAPREKNYIIVSGALSNRKHGLFILGILITDLWSQDILKLKVKCEIIELNSFALCACVFV